VAGTRVGFCLRGDRCDISRKDMCRSKHVIMKKSRDDYMNITGFFIIAFGRKQAASN